MPGEELLEGFCPDCGAENPLSADRCWMCGRQGWKAAAGGTSPVPASAPSPLAQSAREIARKTAWTSECTLVALLGAVSLATVAVWIHNPAEGIILGLVLGVPLMATTGAALTRAGRAMSHEQRLQTRQPASAPAVALVPAPQPMTTGEKAGTFFRWLLYMATTVAVIGVVAIVLLVLAVIACIVALFQVCGGIKW